MGRWGGVDRGGKQEEAEHLSQADFLWPLLASCWHPRPGGMECLSLAVAPPRARGLSPCREHARPGTAAPSRGAECYHHPSKDTATSVSCVPAGIPQFLKCLSTPQGSRTQRLGT